MKNFKKNITLLIIIISGILLFVLNRYGLMNYFNYEIYFKLSIIVIALELTLSSFLVFRTKIRKELKKTLFVIATLFLFFNIYLSVEYYKIKEKERLHLEYNNIKTSKGVEDRFKLDLKNDELKYFSYGMGVDEILVENLKRKYNIRTFNEGCIVLGNGVIYNVFLEKYLLKNYKITINDIDGYEEE